MNLKNSEYVSKCSEIDNVIVFLSDGTYMITNIEDKKFIGENIIYVSIWKKNDAHMIYNLIYKDLSSNISYVKRFSVTSIVKDKKYNVSKGEAKILYFTANPNSESEVVSIHLHYKAKVKNKNFNYDFSDINIKGRHSKGNIVTKYNVRKIEQKSIGESTLGGRELYVDENIGKLNVEKRGRYLGLFNSEDKIIVLYKDGSYEITNFDLSNRYKMSDISILEKYNKEKIYSAVHQDGKSKKIYIKRFNVNTNTLSRRYNFISENRGSKLLALSNLSNLNISYNYRINNGEKRSKNIYVNDYIDVKGYTAQGRILDNKKRMSSFVFVNMSLNDDHGIDERDNNSKHENDELTLF